MKICLSEGWKLRSEELWVGPDLWPEIGRKRDGWMEVVLPCDVHVPLVENGLIREPLLADNSFACRWIEERSWWFMKEFTLDGELLSGESVELVLESLDSEADIFLNGFHIGHHKSAFYPFRVDIRDKAAGMNTLLVRLSCGPEHYSDQDIARYKRHAHTTPASERDSCSRADFRTPFVRKPQYVYGWDHVPRLATCGMNGNAYIEYHEKFVIRSVHAYTEAIAGQDANITVSMEVEDFHPYATLDALVKLDISIGTHPVYEICEEVFLKSGINHLDFRCTISNALLWWPNGMGDQNLYSVKASVESEGVMEEYPEFRFGIRKVCLDTRKINPSERLFAFTVNGVRAYCKGGDWVPGDSIYSRVKDEKYRILLEEAREANFNMLRVWGGGIYEKDIFYDLCDQLGIMLWQDFMFACAQYPDELDWFEQEVEKEAQYQVRRLRSHPSVALWSGNNENHEFFSYAVRGKNPPTRFGGGKIYNHLLPTVVKNLSPEIPYWNSSPYGGKEPSSEAAGDVHRWGTGAMNQDPLIRTSPWEYDRSNAKFVSEYGYVGPCRKSSVLKYLDGQPFDRNNRVWKLHNNRFDWDSVSACIGRHYTDPEVLDNDRYLFYGGLAQGTILGYSLESFRFKENCSGSLIWDYNDSWGETGWSIIDYYTTRKISYYFVKRALAHRKLIMREADGIIRVMGINDTPQPLDFSVEYGYVSLDGKSRDIRESAIILPPCSRHTVLEFTRGSLDESCGIWFVRPLNAELEVLPAILQVTEYKNLNGTEARLAISDMKIDGRNMTFVVSSDTYAHGVHFNVEDTARLSDQFFELLPGESRKVVIYGIPSGFDPDRLCAYYIDGVNGIC